MSQNHFAPHKHNENAEIAIKISDSFSVTRILKVKLRKVIFFLGIVHTCFLFWGFEKVRFPKNLIRFPQFRFQREAERHASYHLFDVERAARPERRCWNQRFPLDQGSCTHTIHDAIC